MSRVRPWGVRQKIRAFLLFHSSLFGASLAISIFIGLYYMWKSQEFSITTIGFAYLFTPLLMQYFIYELRNKGVYYFYYNLGINKVQLWTSTIVLNIVIAGLITLISWLGYTLIV